MLIWFRSSPLERMTCLIKWKTEGGPGFDGSRNGCKASWASPCLSSTHVAFSSTPSGSCLTENPSIQLVSKQLQTVHAAGYSMQFASLRSDCFNLWILCSRVNYCKHQHTVYLDFSWSGKNLSDIICVHIFPNQLLILAEGLAKRVSVNVGNVCQIKSRIYQPRIESQRCGQGCCNHTSVTDTHHRTVQLVGAQPLMPCVLDKQTSAHIRQNILPIIKYTDSECVALHLVTSPQLGGQLGWRGM